MFLERNPKYSDDNYSTIITGDSFFYYSPKIIGTLDMVNKTRILTMAFGNADIRFENLLMNSFIFTLNTIIYLKVPNLLLAK